jgi:hypothetical protein
VPLIDNQPKDKNIFSDDNFPVWMNFSVEPENINFIVAAAGFAIKDKNLVDPQIAKLLPDQSNYHIHGAIFEKQLLNKDPLKIDEEIERIITDLDVVKVQHLLGQTKLGSGIAGIIDLSV